MLRRGEKVKVERPDGYRYGTVAQVPTRETGRPWMVVVEFPAKKPSEQPSHEPVVMDDVWPVRQKTSVEMLEEVAGRLRMAVGQSTPLEEWLVANPSYGGATAPSLLVTDETGQCWELQVTKLQ